MAENLGSSGRKYWSVDNGAVAEPDVTKAVTHGLSVPGFNHKEDSLVQGGMLLLVIFGVIGVGKLNCIVCP